MTYEEYKDRMDKVPDNSVTMVLDKHFNVKYLPNYIAVYANKYVKEKYDDYK